MLMAHGLVIRGTIIPLVTIDSIWPAIRRADLARGETDELLLFFE
jgi:hypothetical protein